MTPGIVCNTNRYDRSCRVSSRPEGQAFRQWSFIACSLAFLAWNGTFVALAQAQRPKPLRIASAQESIHPRPLGQSRELPQAAPGSLTMVAVENFALANNPSLHRAAAMVDAARGNWLQVGLLPNPTAGYDGQQLGSGGRAEQQGVMFSQEFVRGGKLRLNRAVAEQELFQAEQQLVAQRQRVLTDVRRAFFQLLVAQQQIELTNNLVRISGQGAEVADSLFRAKEASRADILQAQLEVENTRILAQNARNRHDAARRVLSSVTGIPDLPAQSLEGDIFAPPKDFDFDETLTRLQSSSPEITIATSEISRARFAYERARAEPIPNVSVQGMINVLDNGIGGKPDGSLALSMPIPVFNRNQGAIHKAQYEIAAAEQALRQVEFDLQNRLAPTFERYANARNQVERYQTAILPVAGESLELTRKMYEAGEASFLVLLTAQRTFSQTNLSFLEALRELRTAEIEIEGLLLSGSLTAAR